LHWDSFRLVQGYTTNKAKSGKLLSFCLAFCLFCFGQAPYPKKQEFFGADYRLDFGYSRFGIGLKITQVWRKKQLQNNSSLQEIRFKTIHFTGNLDGKFA
jgi:hypothetical protein